MAYLKVYEWESATWPQFKGVMLERDTDGRKIIKKLCRHFKVPMVEIEQSYRRGAGNGLGGKYIRGWWFGHRTGIIKIGKQVSLATLVHEFAHHLEAEQYKHIGHGRTFKRALKRSYTWAKRWLPPLAESEEGKWKSAGSSLS